MEITETMLYAEIGKAVVRASAFEQQCRQFLTENRRLTQELETLQASQAVPEAEDGS